jgi:hypothetical protein
MKLLLILLLFFIPLIAMAVGPPIPSEFIGDWVPQKSSCTSSTRLRIDVDSVTLINGSDSQKYGDIDLCYSCEGGAQYSGEVVWLFPDFNKGNKSKFAIAFNAEEKKGITVIEF